MSNTPSLSENPSFTAGEDKEPMQGDTSVDPFNMVFSLLCTSDAKEEQTAQVEASSCANSHFLQEQPINDHHQRAPRSSGASGTKKLTCGFHPET